MELKLVWTQDFKTVCDTFAAAWRRKPAQKHQANEEKRCKCVLSFKKAPSPSVLFTLLLATHEQSLSKELQGAVLACSATLAGFKFTWTTDMGGEHSRRPSVPLFLWPFPWKPHTVAAALNTPQNRGSYFFLLSPHLGGVSTWGSRAGCDERMRAVSAQKQMGMLGSRKNKWPDKHCVCVCA